MLSFKPITVDSGEVLRPYFNAQKYRICDYTVGTAIMWADYFSAEYAEFNGMLVIKNTLRNGHTAFSVPIGAGSVEEALCAIDRYAMEREIPTVFEPVPESCISVIANHYYGELTVRYSPDWSDYLYDKNDIIKLQGRRYNAQRNNINKFKKHYGEYVYDPITTENLDEVRAFFQDYIKYSEHKNPLSDQEKEMTMKVLDHYPKLSQTGGVIRAAGEIVAIAVGERVGDTLFVHIEKARRDFQGSSAVINMEFAKNNDTPCLKFVNREEDMGDPGLRTAKSRYGPIEMLRKYSVTVPQGKGRCL
ncbi:MAG: DUF2156 domain-containing protein [Christensenellales bacterium]|jgi:hypothetical protein